MTYQQTVEYLYTRLPMFSRIGAAAIKKDLTNTIRLCAALGNPEQTFKCIHVAGTNGKGSTSHMLAAVLQTAGYKTGLYTSPHLHDFRERIKINGKMCDEQFVVDFTRRIQPLIEEIEPSFFEITVAMAFEYFAQGKVDVAVIETGLGGRLDSTNVILPVLSVITNIGWDHMQLLGDTLPKIAAEKAGIIKPGIPVVIGESQAETKEVFKQTASSATAQIVFADEQRYIDDFQQQQHLLAVRVTHPSKNEKTSYLLDLTGIYQTRNLLTVLESVHQLQLMGWNIAPHDIYKALQHVKQLTGLHGRWEKISDEPAIILDVAHNVDGIRQVAEQLRHENYRQLYIIVGMVKDKDVDAVLQLLPTNARYIFTAPPVERALDATTLQEKAAAHHLQGTIAPDVNAAMQEALTHAKPADLILVCGSVFLVAALKS